MYAENNEQRAQVASADDRFHRSRCNTSLFRILATNIVRQLREGGHHGHELLSFASEVMEAIADSGGSDAPVTPAPKGSIRAAAPGPPLQVTEDEAGHPVLSGERVVLRFPLERDRAALQRWQGDSLVRASLILPQLQRTLERLGERASQDERIERLICDRANGTPIGLVCLRNIDPDIGQAELCKMIGEASYRGKGAAREATHLIVTYGFDVLNLNRIYLRTLGGNLRNIRLNERMGFRFEGVLREAVRIDDRIHDVVLMAALRSERADPVARQ